MLGKSILVVDDEKSICESLKGALEDEGFKVSVAECGEKALELLKKDYFDLVILDILLPDIDGLDVLKAIKKDDPDLPIIVMSGHGTIEIAVKAIKLGAYNFLEKPISLDELIIDIQNALKMERLHKTAQAYRESIAEDFIGVSDWAKRVRELIEQVSASDAPVLIVGENGTGKGIIARLIHRKSPRKDGPFVEIQCSMIPDEFIEMELFGCEANVAKDGKPKKGKLELAEGGSVFFDEIGDLSLKAQSRILKVIEDRVIERLGGSRLIGVDVKVFASTRKDLKKEVEKGNFREDLYYRLNVVKIEIPPLRKRREDIRPLADYFLKMFSSKYGKDIALSEDAYFVLENHTWPGNVRELRNTMERLCILGKDGIVDGKKMASFVESYTIDSDEIFSMDNLKDALRRFEREFIKRKLMENKGNIIQTAKKIGIGRRNLYYRIKNLGINLDDIREG